MSSPFFLILSMIETLQKSVIYLGMYVIIIYKMQQLVFKACSMFPWLVKTCTPIACHRYTINIYYAPKIIINVNIIMSLVYHCAMNI